MIITNKHNLPRPVALFLAQDFYDHAAVRGTFSVTTLLKPIQEILLLRRHKDAVEMDVSDRLFILDGCGMHAVLAKIEDPDIEPPRRLYADFMGEKISGEYDLIYKNTIEDFKMTSVWTIIYKSREEEWVWQLSLYRWLYWKETNMELNPMGNIHARLRDWTKTLAAKYKDAPPTGFVTIPYVLQTFDEVEAFLTKKIGALQAAADAPDDKLPPCSDEERWYNKKTKKYIKCESYCLARQFCHQRQAAEREKLVGISEQRSAA